MKGSAFPTHRQWINRKLKRATRKILQAKRVTPKGTKLIVPTQVYEEATEELDNGNWKAAEQGLQQFATKFPGDSRQPAALYRLGELHFRGKKYRLAFAKFKEVIKINPKQKEKVRRFFIILTLQIIVDFLFTAIRSRESALAMSLIV